MDVSKPQGVNIHWLIKLAMSIKYGEWGKAACYTVHPLNTLLSNDH